MCVVLAAEDGATPVVSVPYKILDWTS